MALRKRENRSSRSARGGARLEQELALARGTNDVTVASEGGPRQSAPDRQREADAAAPALNRGKSTRRRSG